MPPAMRYRRFGRTELQLPVITLGGMRYQQSWKDELETTPESDRNVHDVVHKAYALGINHFETARGYGTSELQLGKVLPDFPRDSYVVTTKVTPRENVDEFLREVDKSLTRLGLDYIDNFDIHGINLPIHGEYTLRKGGCLEAARKLQAQGVIGHIGFSTHGSLQVIMDMIESNEFASVNLHFYYFNQSKLRAVQRAAELDMGILIISPHDKGGQLWKPPQRVRELTAPLHPMTFNSLWCLHFPAVTTLTLGAATVDDIDAHLEVLDLLDDTAALTAEPARRLYEEQRAVLGADFCTFCHDCLPCPEGINIPQVLRLRNLQAALGFDEYARYRYNLMGNAGHWHWGARANTCTDCGDCLPRCPEKLDIPRLLRDAHERFSAADVQRLGSF